MPSPKRSRNPRKTVLEAIAFCAPTTLAMALQTLEDFPSSISPLIVPCWDWKRGNVATPPRMTIRPARTNHPVGLFFGSSYRRECRNHRCVNPYHFTRRPRPPSIPKTTMLIDCEGDLAARNPPSLIKALQWDDYPPALVVQAYRNLREDGVLGSICPALRHPL